MSTLPLIDSASLLPCESKKPNCPLPIHTPCGGGGAGASSAQTPTVGERIKRVVTATRKLNMILLEDKLIGWRGAAGDRLTPRLLGFEALKRVSRASREFPRAALRS